MDKFPRISLILYILKWKYFFMIENTLGIRKLYVIYNYITLFYIFIFIYFFAKIYSYFFTLKQNSLFQAQKLSIMNAFSKHSLTLHGNVMIWHDDSGDFSMQATLMPLTEFFFIITRNVIFWHYYQPWRYYLRLPII